MADAQTQPPLKFTGAKYLTQRLILATLTGRPIRISQIRSKHANPGLLPHEVSFIRLLDSITNGSTIEFSYTGTTLVYRPGLITGCAPGHGANIHGVIKHELPRECTRGISYFLIPLCQLAPFSKEKINVLFTGPGVITSSTPAGDVSVDTVRTAILPAFRPFGILANMELRILRRSNPGPGGRSGGGEVQLLFGHQVRLPKTIHALAPGRVKQIRGVAYATGVAGANNARMIETARGVLNEFVPDTYIFSDVSSAPFVPAPTNDNPGNKRKIGVGFGMSLVAETSTGVLFSADVASPPQGGEPPEDVGRKCAYQLLENIALGGCASPLAAPTVLTLMAMGSEDVGRLQMGRDVVGSEEIIQLGRDLRALGGTGWGLRDAGNEEGDIVVSVVGRGVGNVGRKIA